MCFCWVLKTLKYSQKSVNWFLHFDCFLNIWKCWKYRKSFQIYKNFCMMMLNFLNFSLIEISVTRAHLLMFFEIDYVFWILRSHFREFRLIFSQTFFRLQMNYRSWIFFAVSITIIRIKKNRYRCSQWSERTVETVFIDRTSE